MIPKVSVIVPVYNVEKYLKRCLDSILEQTYGNIEIILIDDGSTDCSGKICDAYAETYTNIKIIHKANMGLSDSRNVGIANARGEYIYFLDSDDYIIRECIEILYKNAIENDADLSCGSFGFFDDNHPVVVKKMEVQSLFACSGKKACIHLLYEKRFYTSSCNILIKRDIAAHNLFPIGKYHEDEMTTFRYYLMASKVILTNINTYYYYQRMGSIMHSFGQQVFDEAFSADYYVHICKGLGGKFYKAALCKKYSLYTSIMETYPQIKTEEPEFYSKLYRYTKNKGIDILLDLHAPLSIKRKAMRCLMK